MADPELTFQGTHRATLSGRTGDVPATNKGHTGGVQVGVAGGRAASSGGPSTGSRSSPSWA